MAGHKKKKKEIATWSVVWYFVFVVVLFYLFGASYSNTGNLRAYVHVPMYANTLDNRNACENILRVK